jgi:hypothetical protein
MRSTRRSLLLTCAMAGWGIARQSAAIGPRAKVGIGQIQYGGTWDTRPEALRRLLWETGKRTSIDVARDATPVTLHDPELFWHPLLVMTGEGEPPPLTPEQRAQLERHLRYGGMLWIDVPTPDSPLAEAMRREIAAMFPAEAWEKLPTEHVLYRSYFLLEGQVGRTQSRAGVEALRLGDRLSVLLTTNDVLGAYERDRFGTWRYDCVPDGEKQREQAFRFGVNVLMYATCLDYKADQVHIPFILKKTRR